MGCKKCGGLIEGCKSCYRKEREKQEAIEDWELEDG